MFKPQIYNLYQSILRSHQAPASPSMSSPSLARSTLSGAHHTGKPETVEKPREIPYSKQFFDKDNAASRRAYLTIFISGCFIIVVALFGVLSIYWGSAWKTPAGKLEGWVVDFDGGAVGESVVQQLTAKPVTAITWRVLNASGFPEGPTQLGRAVLNQRVWIGMSINEGVTARLRSSLISPNATYNGSDAVTVYVNEGRSENAYRVYVRPSFEGSLTNISQSFAKQYAHGLVSTNLTLVLSRSPQTLTTPIWYTIDNLAPFNLPVASAVTLVGLIYELMLIFFVVAVEHAAREGSGLSRNLTLRSLIITRFISSFLVFFVVSAFFSLLSLAFQVDFSRHYGHVGFFIFWMFNWLEMLATGLALETMITLLGSPYVPYFMLLWVIVNVSVCSYPIEMLPWIYRYGYGMPFYNVSHASRTLMFGTKNMLGLNAAVLISWTVVSCITLPLVQWYMRRRAIIAARTQKIENPPTPERVQLEGAGISSEGGEVKRVSPV